MRNKSIRVVSFLTLFAAAAQTVAAQRVRPAFAEVPGEGLPAPVQVAASFLQLSEEQLSRLLELRDGIEEDRQALQHSLQELERTLNEALADPAADAESVGEVVLQIREHRQALHSIQQGFIESVAELLDEEQQARLYLIHRAAELQQLLPAFHAVGLLP